MPAVTAANSPLPLEAINAGSIDLFPRKEDHRFALVAMMSSSRGCSSMAGRWFRKLDVGGRFPSSAPDFRAGSGFGDQAGSFFVEPGRHQQPWYQLVGLREPSVPRMRGLFRGQMSWN